MIKKSLSYTLVACSIAIGLLISSCNNHTDKEEVVSNRVFADYHYALDSVIKSKEGIICGIELGQSAKLIPAKEVSQALEKTNDHLTFEQTIDSLSKYTITYSFENDSITEMEVLITSKNSDEGEKILNDLKSYYSKK